MVLNRFSAPYNIMKNYGQVLYTWFVAPESGSYTFFLSVDDIGQFFLSSDATKNRKKILITQKTWTYHNVFNKYVNELLK